MGYTTDFSGSFKLDNKLDADTHKLLNGLASTRRVARRIEGYGIDGEFYIEGEGLARRESEIEDIIDNNRPPRTQPSLWCQWVPTSDGMEIEWDGGEKFYEYVEWIEYLINSVLKPRGYVLNGEIDWYGEDRSDMGKIVVTNNSVAIKRALVSYR